MPGDLAALDRVLGDQALMGPILERFRRELLETGRRVLEEGRPTIPMETFVRLMVLKARYRWGYWMLVGEVSDSIALRRFCRISLCERVPDESTVRKLTRRLGPETVLNLTRMLVVRAARERRFWPRAVRVDSTVVEADVKYPTDSGLASPWRQGAGAGSSQAGGSDRREQAAGAGSLAGGGPRAAGDHSHNPGSFGEAKAQVLKLTAQTGELLERSVKEARQLAAVARRRARGRGAKHKLNAGRRTQTTGDLSPREVALDGGFQLGPTSEALAELAPERVFISGHQEPGSRRTNQRPQRYRTGAEGHISHLKRRYGMGRSRLKGHDSQRIWTEWGILAHNTDTLAVRAR